MAHGRLALVLVAGATALSLAMSPLLDTARAAETAVNPLSVASTLPFQAPMFDKIKDTDFEPAFTQAMAEHLREIQAIADNPAKPTFANTIVAMEKSGTMLDRVSQIFDNLNSANTNDLLQKVDEIEAPKRAAHNDAIYLNPRLFARVEAIYNEREQLHLDPEALQLVTVYYDDFVHAGARLSPGDATKLKALNERLSALETAFNQKLLAAAKAGALVVTDKAALAGLSPGGLSSAASAAADRGLKGSLVVPLQNTTQQPALAELDDRATRETLFNNGWTRAERGDANDTRATILELARLRSQKAALLGHPNYAAYVLEDQMAKTPEAVDQFMAQLVGPVRAKAAKEAADLQAAIAKDGQSFTLQPWDWDRYSDQIRKTRFNLDQSELKPYLELDNVLKNGVFYAANQLYGVTFKPRADLPVYQPDVKVFEVIDKDGSPLGLMYFDYFKRDNKSGGAWMSNFVGQSKLLGSRPVIYNVANFTKPAAGEPALISFEDVTTMFHEFGHALHGLFADQEYPSLSGTNVARDFVEFPSQFNEHWALDPKVLAHYAVHYKTGAPMPQNLVDKIKNAATFNQGYAFGEVVAAAELDLRWHSLSPKGEVTDVDTFETEALQHSNTDFPNVPPRYRSSYFLHIWSNGYAAGYYAYIWTEMLDDDAYSWFMKNGGLTRQNGQRFRDMILSKGHTEDYGPMFRAFYGKDPDIGPLLVHRGLAEEPGS